MHCSCKNTVHAHQNLAEEHMEPDPLAWLWDWFWLFLADLADSGLSEVTDDFGCTEPTLLEFG